MIKGASFAKALWPGLKKWYNSLDLYKDIKNTMPNKTYTPPPQKPSPSPLTRVPHGAGVYASSHASIMASSSAIYVSAIDDYYNEPITITQKDELEAMIYSLMERVAQLEANQVPGEGGQTEYHILP